MQQPNEYDEFDLTNFQEHQSNLIFESSNCKTVVDFYISAHPDYHPPRVILLYSYPTSSSILGHIRTVEFVCKNELLRTSKCLKHGCGKGPTAFNLQDFIQNPRTSSSKWSVTRPQDQIQPTVVTWNK